VVQIIKCSIPSVKHIGTGAFFDCKSLSILLLPEGIDRTGITSLLDVIDY